MADRTLHNLVLRIARSVVQRELQKPGLARPLPNVSPSRIPGVAAVDQQTTAEPTARLISGGDVDATNPPSFNVIQRAFKGVSYGVNVASSQEITIEIPKAEGIGYLVVNHQSVVQFTYNYPTSNQLATAAIHVPYEDTYEIRDEPSEDPDDHVGWIEPFQDSFFTGNIDGNDPNLLNAIKDIAAEGLIGNLVLSETLKIINAAGSIVLDSQTIQIFDGSGNLRALFDEDSVDFFDADGIQTATFGGDQARVGNILLNPDDLRSRDWVTDTSGFIIRADGSVEFNEGGFKGTLVGRSVVQSGSAPPTYDEGGTSSYIGRWSYIIPLMQVSDGEILTFDGNTKTDALARVGGPNFPAEMPNFRNQAHVTMVEHSGMVWHSSLSTSVTYHRRFEAIPIHSGTSDEMNAFVIHARIFPIADVDFTTPGVGQNLQPDAVLTPPASPRTSDQTRDAIDAYIDPQQITGDPTKTSDCLQVQLFHSVQHNTGPIPSENAIFRNKIVVHIGTDTNASLGLGGTFTTEAKKTVEFDVYAIAIAGVDSYATDTVTVTFLPEELSRSVDKCIMVEWLSTTQISGPSNSGWNFFIMNVQSITWRDTVAGVAMDDISVGLHITQD